ncbi:MAG TPA: caspase family protein [Acidimicrobiales bacterium]|nr:caspase family protein [Acidimicrobiales bacterium]
MLVTLTLGAGFASRIQQSSTAGRSAALGRARADAGLVVPVDAAAAPAGLPGDVAISPPPDQFDGPAVTEAPPGALARGRFPGVVPSGGTWAVMIGINNYPGSRHDLRSAVADALDVDEALARMGVPGNHRLVVKDGQAAARVVTLAADWLVAHAGPDAVAVFFYAGHVRKVGGGTEAVIAADGNAVTDATLADHLRPLQARQAWIGIAACYGGGFTELLAPGRVLSAAASANRLAYENAAFGRSYMVQFMVREAMIEGRANASVQHSFDYAKATIAYRYPGREPVEIDSGSGPLSLRPPGAGPPSTVKPAPKPAPAPANSGGGSNPPPPSSPPSGGSGSGSSGGTCKSVNLGVIRCR